MQLNKPWLVTGSRGYVGRHLTDSFGRSGLRYIGVDQKTGHWATSGLRENELLGNINDSSFVANLLSKYDFQGVVHLAALKDVSEALKEPDRYLQQNLIGSMNFLTSVIASGIDKIIFASSAAVYGNRNTDHGFVESDPLEASNPYSQSKIGVENFLMTQSQNAKVEAIALRFFNIGGCVYGIDSDLDCNNLIPRIFRAVERQEDIFVYGNSFPTEDGTAIRDYVNVEDVIEAISCWMVNPGNEESFDVFNVATGRGLSTLQVLKEFEKIHMEKIQINLLPPRSEEASVSIADISKIIKRFNWNAQKTFEDSVSEVIDQPLSNV
jgi:UDP-glucose 4-epimerase